MNNSLTPNPEGEPQGEVQVTDFNPNISHIHSEDNHDYQDIYD